MTADESQPVGQVLRRLDHRALGAPDIGDDRVCRGRASPAREARPMFCRTGAASTIRSAPSARREVVPPGVGRLTAERLVDDLRFGRSR